MGVCVCVTSLNGAHQPDKIINIVILNRKITKQTALFLDSGDSNVTSSTPAFQCQYPEQNMLSYSAVISSVAKSIRC